MNEIKCSAKVVIQRQKGWGKCYRNIRKVIGLALECGTGIGLIQFQSSKEGQPLLESRLQYDGERGRQSIVTLSVRCKTPKGAWSLSNAHLALLCLKMIHRVGEDDRKKILRRTTFFSFP